jgi:hypothetical protein
MLEPMPGVGVGGMIASLDLAMAVSVANASKVPNISGGVVEVENGFVGVIVTKEAKSILLK